MRPDSGQPIETMIENTPQVGDWYQLRLPATSANLGPAFDAAGLAMAFHLSIRAQPSTAYSIQATGRDVPLIEQLDQNLILETYQSLAGPSAPRLRLEIHNEIPLGKGCGSSAAALLAGVRLANHFGSLGWSEDRVLLEACRLEGHPDNVAACFHGGFTVSALTSEKVVCATFGRGLPWRLWLVVPAQSLSTSVARALLPAQYSREDAVRNLQAVALLVSAFASGRGDLLGEGTRDTMHQPARSTACPLLPRLLPLAGFDGIWSVTLSGAGPSVLLIADPDSPDEAQRAAIQNACGSIALELLRTTIEG